ncbi:CAMK family protein kinase [Trichomonas vaginalis G3]|uniref:CAMK family protein kinase n=1 Tax=Trichomonas vaginalis (strain ATCC PRA-98 / G3) TaxID=412133 RepID=A2GAV1_TRIV3|nr:protein serine/threonine kinase protein [Trichomonas vaginalis G3]EAX85713.1 CAMK family protein kinase [Trichomonas vaginalis G3]KAI5551740.1 protein serine/threonine kinase protein [Trichomonas vaginalis G3]|eukprot:XP_001298643.1 CAMK family protein kinase [Trichomonas vaginalis G3]
MDTVTLSFGDNSEVTIPKIFENYEFVRKIGYGSFSSVVLVRHLKTKEYFACKIVSRKMLEEQQIFSRFEQEVRLMQSFNHPYVIHTFDVVFDPQYIYIVMEYCPNGELFSYILSLVRLPEMEVNRILRQILQALQYIHSKKVAHRDIKPENILLDSHMDIRLSDFGLCKEMSHGSLLKTPCGSPFYAPPEIINNDKYDGVKSDIWSLGVVVFTMSTGALPWSHTNHAQLFKQITTTDVTVPQGLSPPLRQIITLMLQRDPNARPTPTELLAMPWLADDSSIDSTPTPLRRRYSSDNTAYARKLGTADHRLQRKSLVIRPENMITPQETMNLAIRKVPKLTKPEPYRTVISQMF